MVQLLPLFAPNVVRAGTGIKVRLILVTAASLALAFPGNAGSLTIATWNVENYLPTGRHVDGAYRKDYPKPEVEKAALRAVVQSTGADLIVLQEMGDETHLAELQRDLARDEIEYPHSAWLAGDDPDRHIAILSRIPFARVVKHEKVATRFLNEAGFVRRGLLEVALDADGAEVTVFAVHLKSRYTQRKDDPQAAAQRAAEAVAIRDLVLKRFPEPASARFVIAGDFNDTRESRPLRAMTQRGETTIARLLPATDDRGDVWTHHFHGNDSYSRVDFILVSPGLEGSASSLDLHVVDTPRVRGASDHRPVLLKVEWK